LVLLDARGEGAGGGARINNGGGEMQSFDRSDMEDEIPF
jgi:hypothetical protein